MFRHSSLHLPRLSFRLDTSCLLWLMTTLAIAIGMPCHAQTAVPAASPRVAVMTGYHGYNAILLENVLQPRGGEIIAIPGWLDPIDYPQFGVVVIDGSLKGAQITPHEFSPEGLERLRQYLQAGGTLVLMNQGAITLNTPHGRSFLAQTMGSTPGRPDGQLRVQRDHGWVAHLGESTPAWLLPTLGRGLPCTSGQSIIEQHTGLSILHHANVGQGQLIYIGWDISRFRPETRAGITPEKERTFNQQVMILDRIARDLFPQRPAEWPQRVFFNDPYELEPDRRQSQPSPTDPRQFQSHGPTRPLPEASMRPLPAGDLRFVDPIKGDDAASGQLNTPWKTVQHAVDHCQPGQMLVLRGGTYYEHIQINRSGKVDQPITLRSYPGEIAILDGSFRAFQDQPQTAWEPVTDGAAGEFRSTQIYPDIPVVRDGANVLGRFGDSLIPLHGYRFLADMRSDNPYWTIPSNVGQESAVYCGPGIWYDPATQRIHCRLAHTRLSGLGQDNYAGVTDPREIPLIIAAEEPTLTIRQARHIRLQDLVLRGSKGDTLLLHNTRDIQLDGVTLFGGRTCLLANYTQGLRIIHTAFRGIGSPWATRAHLKYRSIEAQLLTASKWEPAGNSDFEIAYCEFTDSADGIFLGSVRDVRFHHNLLDNITDDGLFLTALTDGLGHTEGGPTLIYQNRFNRCLTTFAFGTGHGRQFTDDRGKHTGRGLWICRNVLDFRQPLLITVPVSAEAPQAFNHHGRNQGDHGSPIWEPLAFYHNTILAPAPAWRNYYLHGWGGHANATARLLFNNIVVQSTGAPGATLQTKPIALLFDGNVHFTFDPKQDASSFKNALRTSVERTFQGQPHEPDALVTPFHHPLKNTENIDVLQELLQTASSSDVPYRGQRDRYVEPGFMQYTSDWKKPIDLHLKADAAAADAGVPLPANWFDPLKGVDDAAPDAGAVPRQHPGWRVGVGGRIDPFQ